MQNETEDFYNDPVYELLEALVLMSTSVTHPVRQFVTCLLSGFFVVGILLIVPALMQTAAAYVWAAQVRKECNIHVRTLDATRKSIAQATGTRVEPGDVTQAEVQTVRKLLSKQDRTLFLYRLLACCASLFVLIFSTLPQLVIAIAKPTSATAIDKMWGWCQAFVYADYSTRCLATYLIVVPFGLMYWNYFFSEIVPRYNLLTDNVFRVILLAAIPIAMFSFLVPIPLVAQQFRQAVNEFGVQCDSTPNALVTALYYDFAVTRVIPVILVIGIGSGFLRWLPRSDYGVFYEPGIFILFVLPHMLCELIIHICHRAHLLHYLVGTNFSNFMLLTYSFYHMSFSSTFVLATMRSVVAEIREEMRRRQFFFLGDLPDEVEENAPDFHGTKRRTNLIHGLQKQFSVAFRWKPDFTEEETRIIINNPIASALPEGRGDVVDSVEEVIPLREGISAEEGKQGKVDDAVLHYAILQRSAHLKKQEDTQYRPR
ncbi:hypothetical protein P879_01222 [Paragonimus westermani]|uniref:Uncharacterized protein n=1 Tax=Paragonimus westermani TaxID=34504 RepID=A0A8T0DDK7_9TREM|nr:hypothetical protein P879_01222 [Paragonimus westermani]